MDYFTPEEGAFQKTIRYFFVDEANPHIDEWEKARAFMTPQPRKARSSRSTKRGSPSPPPRPLYHPHDSDFVRAIVFRSA